jgi:hypothetical protein
LLKVRTSEISFGTAAVFASTVWLFFEHKEFVVVTTGTEVISEVFWLSHYTIMMDD